MKKTNIFKETIRDYLDRRAECDALFAGVYANPEKNIDDCCTYIVNEVKKSGRNVFADEEIYGMAVHYYDEEDIEAGKPTACRVVVSRGGEGLTEAEKREVREGAREAYMQECLAELKRKAARPARKKNDAEVEQGSLF